MVVNFTLKDQTIENVWYKGGRCIIKWFPLFISFIFIYKGILDTKDEINISDIHSKISTVPLRTEFIPDI